MGEQLEARVRREGLLVPVALWRLEDAPHAKFPAEVEFVRIGAR